MRPAVCSELQPGAALLSRLVVMRQARRLLTPRKPLVRISTPAIAAAFSLVCPQEIAFQNGHRSARCSTGGLPCDRSLGLSDRLNFNLFGFITASG